MAKAEFPAQLLSAGYAAFMSEDDFNKLSGISAVYEVLRATIRTEAKQGTNEAWNPAPPTDQEGYFTSVN